MYTKCSTNWVLFSAFDTYATGTADQRIQEGTGMCCFQSKSLHLGKVCNPLQLEKKSDKSTEIWRQKFHQIFLQVNHGFNRLLEVKHLLLLTKQVFYFS